MKELRTFERETLRYLFECAGKADLYALHERYRLSPAQILYTLTRLEQAGLVELDGLTAALNERGRLWILMNRRQIFMEGVQRYWATPRSVNSSDATDQTKPHVPTQSRLKKRLSTRTRLHRDS